MRYVHPSPLFCLALYSVQATEYNNIDGLLWAGSNKTWLYPPYNDSTLLTQRETQSERASLKKHVPEECLISFQ